MNIRLRFITFLSLGFLLFSLGQFAYAQEGLVKCGLQRDANGVVVNDNQCSFDDLITLAQTVINFLIFDIAAPLAALLFAYAGFLMLTNSGNEGKITQAKAIFFNVFIGLVVAIAAWLLVDFVLNFFRVNSDSATPAQRLLDNPTQP